MVLANLFQNLASLFELYLLGRVGLEALAAISIVMSSIFALNLSVHGGLINGAIAIISRYAGAKKYDEINRVVVQMFIFSAFVFGVFSLAIFIFLNPMLSFFGAKDAVLVMASDYVKVFLLSFLPFSVYTIGMAALRSAGDSITPLKVILVMMFFNILLNPLFIIVLHMGVMGAAMSALVMNTAAAVYYIIVFSKGIHFFKLKLSDFRIEWPIMSKYAFLAVKSIGQGFTGDIGTIAMLKIVSTFGNPMIAAYGIVSKLAYYLFMFAWPIGNSGGLVVGQNLGMKIKERAKKTVIETVRFFACISVPVSVLFFIFAVPIMQLFSSDAVVLKYGVFYLRLTAVVLPLFGIGLNIQSAFNGAGSTGTPTLVTFVTFIIVRIPLALLLPAIPVIAETGVFWAVTISMALYAVIYIILYNKGSWIHKEI
jgi:putative MATE family efflux protein